jgi:FAD/FMN-containing dehydrogenase
MSVLLNDIHGRLGPTRVRKIIAPHSMDELQTIVRDSGDLPISIAGGRHAMGGQQFGEDTLHLDTRTLNRVLDFDPQRGWVRAEAGIQWPELIEGIRARNSAPQPLWGIRQKQTGASDLTLGGALSANVHGRGLRMRPFIDDVEAFTLIDPEGRRLVCNRSDNADLFRFVIGGYGLFGVIYDVTLRLSPRRRVQRRVDVETSDVIVDRFDDAVDRGSLYGDFQFAIDPRSADFLYRGIFSRYRVVDDDTPIPASQIYFSEDKWLALLRLARTKPSDAYHAYVSFYRSTDGQFYDSDTHQLSTYVPRYHDRLADLPAEAQGSEVISELYVPRADLHRFLRRAADVLRGCQAPVTYGTVRLIQQDTESFLRWASEDYACVIFNLLTPETSAGRDRTKRTFQSLYDIALGMNGSFYLTYHNFATREQVERAYPQLREFLARKRDHDPCERFQSNWYRHMQGLFADSKSPRNGKQKPVSANLLSPRTSAAH